MRVDAHASAPRPLCDPRGCGGRPAPAGALPRPSGPHLWVPPPAMQALTYTVVNRQNKKERIPLLSDVTGCLVPGEMSALMG